VASSSTGGTVTTSGDYTIHTFTTSGTFTAVLATIYTLTCGYGEYALTGQSSTLHKVMTLVCGFGEYVLTGIAQNLRKAFKFTNETKHSITPSNQAKTTASTFTNQAKNTSTITNEHKN
jgi:hypothetical protein